MEDQFSRLLVVFFVALLFVQCEWVVALEGWTIDANVSEEDVRVGAKIRTYVYPLPQKFHQEEFKRYNRGCLVSACSAKHSLVTEHHYTDYSAEIIILAVNSVSVAAPS